MTNKIKTYIIHKSLYVYSINFFLAFILTKSLVRLSRFDRSLLLIRQFYKRRCFKISLKLHGNIESTSVCSSHFLPPLPVVTTKSTTDRTAFPIACTNTTCTVSQRPWRGILETKNTALVKMHQLQKNDSVDLWGRLQGNMNKVV